MENKDQYNIALAGGPCTGKTTLAAYLFAHLKKCGYDYSFVAEESRKIKSKIGKFKSPFELFYLWHIQNQIELASINKNGFITDRPLFINFFAAQIYSKESRDQIAIAELFKMCLEIKDRYDLIIVSKNPREFSYVHDTYRKLNPTKALLSHKLQCSFLEYYWPNKILYVEGSLDERLKQIRKRLKRIRKFSKI